MKYFKSIAVASMIAALPLGANALSFEVLNSSSNISGNTAGDFGAQYGAFLPGGASWVPSEETPVTVDKSPFSVTNAYLSPWAYPAGASTDLSNTNSYFVVQPNAIDGPPESPASPDPVTLSLGGVTDIFTFLWGSIDVENTITFFNGGTEVKSFTGTDIVKDTESGATLAGCGSFENNSYGCVAEVKFFGADFDMIVFSAGTASDGEGGRNSFEFATVPLPAAAWLLLGVSGALVGAKRRSARRAA